jgi:hypothetical protein
LYQPGRPQNKILCVRQLIAGNADDLQAPILDPDNNPTTFRIRHGAHSFGEIGRPGSTLFELNLLFLIMRDQTP